MNNNADTTKVGYTLKENIEFVITKYKENFAQVAKNEQFKWEGIGWYKSHWNIDAEDFASMVKESFSKLGGMITSGNYYPYKMLVVCAQDDPESVRGLFRMLYDETQPLDTRYNLFRNSFQRHIEKLRSTYEEHKKAQNHYQDYRAIMVYLTCEYPEKYFFYKWGMYKDFRDRTGYREKHKNTALGSLLNYLELSQIVLEAVKNDNELLELCATRLTDTCYKDEKHHLLTMEIMWYGASYLSKESFLPENREKEEDVYWPSPEQYSPDLTQVQWEEILRDQTIVNDNLIEMLQYMIELGGESSCSKLAEIYGKTYRHYMMLGNAFAAKVKAKYNCPDCIVLDEDNTEEARVFVIPFVGRYILENGKRKYSWKMRDELKAAYIKIYDSPDLLKDSETDVELNTILYGPPGTGKTYHTVIYAVAIIENKLLADVEKEDYAEVLDRYKAYRKKGRIEFTTFHQSYGYEEFIEGIRPLIKDGENDDSGEIQYTVKPGIFKKFCVKAECSEVVGEKKLELNEDPAIWKVSLYASGDNPIREECHREGHIRIGWDDYGKEISDETDFFNGGRNVLSAFIDYMQIGDIVLSCYSSTTIDAIGIVTGEYEWHEEYDNLKRLRRVNWIVKDIRENIVAVNGGKTMTTQSVYRLRNISVKDAFAIIDKYQVKNPKALSEKAENYVFIIDEINRGNISRIFGELITLIEESKRKGKKEEIEAMLPYSQKPFSIPSNVYILGTMNTADRSIATIDTALRRRFFFREMLPDPGILDDVLVEDLSVSKMLARMNRRIQLLFDSEHTIGHAYFIELKKNPTVEVLAKIFKNTIIPLLQEYFYDDYEKIRLVLADNQKDDEKEMFIIPQAAGDADFFGDTKLEFEEETVYVINEDAFDTIEAYRYI